MTSGGTTVVQVFGAMDRGGAEMRTLELIRRMDPGQVRSIFVTLSGRAGSLAGEFEAAGAEVAPLALSWRFPFAFIRLLRNQQVDAVHSHVATFSGAILLLARIARVRRRIAHFRSDGPSSRPSVAKRMQYGIMRALIRWNATDILGVSPGALTHGWCSDWAKDSRCRVLPSGIDLASFAGVTSNGALRSHLGAGTTDKVVIHIGRGVPLKNRERALRIFAELSRQRPTPWLAFIGADTPDDRARWRHLAADLGISERVDFFGERDDVPQLLADADLLLLTSHYEGLPGVILEAAAVGTPSLASDLPGVRFVASHLPDVIPLSLDASDGEWANSASSLLDRRLTPAVREAACLRMRDGIFDLSRAVPEFLALWTDAKSIEAHR